jgi:hypothetical protein
MRTAHVKLVSVQKGVCKQVKQAKQVGTAHVAHGVTVHSMMLSTAVIHCAQYAGHQSEPNLQLDVCCTLCRTRGSVAAAAAAGTLQPVGARWNTAGCV